MLHVCVVLIPLVLLACSQDNPTTYPASGQPQSSVASPSDLCPTVGFNIELSFFDNVGYSYQNALQRAADRWEGVILSESPGVDFTQTPYQKYHATLEGTISINQEVDDLLIVVSGVDLPDKVLASSGGLLVGSQTKLPVVSTLAFDPAKLALETPENIYRTMLHEIGHALGFGTIWAWDNLCSEYPATSGLDRPHFTGFWAQIMFDIAGGLFFEEKKVPIDPTNGGHWRTEYIGDELMAQGWTWPYRQPLSEVTVGALADLGYAVNYWAAEEYQLPSQQAAKAPPEPTRVRRCPRANPQVWVVGEDGQIQP